MSNLTDLYPILIFLTMVFNCDSQSIENPLPVCPKSPNCFLSEAQHKKELKQPLNFEGSAKEAENQLIKVLENFPDATQEKINFPELHYTFKTKFGKFIDDVHFYIDEKNEYIHFRSTSRVGWSDMGANRRRMRKIKKAWDLRMAE